MGNAPHSFYSAYLIAIDSSDVIWDGILNESWKDKLIPDICDPYFHNLVASRIRNLRQRSQFWNDAKSILARNRPFIEKQLIKILKSSVVKRKITARAQAIGKNLAKDISVPKDLNKLKDLVEVQILDEVSRYSNVKIAESLAAIITRR